jgi:hypothetical protein
MLKFVNQLLSAHLARYPAMRLEDIYKLLHQAALGPGHAVQNAMQARQLLEAEAAQVGAGPAEPERDVISPDGALARIHLRPFIAGGGNLDRLCDAFVATANNWPASTEKLARFCSCLADLADSGGIPFGREEVVAWFDGIAKAGYPAVHHSPEFSERYKPAYRVVNIADLG